MSALALAAAAALIAKCSAGTVPADLIAAVAMHESGFDPLALHVNARGDKPESTFHPLSVSAAVAEAGALIAQGRSVDLGFMQINWQANGRLFGSLADAFDDCRSVRAGEAVLAGSYVPAVRAVLSRYNTGTPDRGLGYASSVERAARLIAAAQGRSAAAPVPEAEPPPLPEPNPITARSGERDLVFTANQ